MAVDAVFEGCYEAHRAAALSGVPISTVYHWARHDVVIPAVSAPRDKLWSYADLMALRIVAWLRRPKDGAVAGTSMTQVRLAMQELEHRGINLWDHERNESSIKVDARGAVFVDDGVDTTSLSRQQVLPDVLDLLGPFRDGANRGPDLRRPRQHLRIVPGKCAGEPHLFGTRVTTPALAALARVGYTLDDVARLYPEQSRTSLAEAIELEQWLAATPTAA